MWPFKDKHKLNTIEPGKTARMSIPIPLDAKGPAEVVIRYGDNFGNEYETRATFDLKNRKIIKQEYKVVKKVKELPAGDEPKLVIEDDGINWPDI